MEVEFWHDRWENNLIGFHLDEINPYLKEYWPALNVKAGARVFVPLSGKTHDLIWLAEQGYEVVAIELSLVAVEAFFSENNLTAEKTKKESLEFWQSGNITLICGNFFALTRELLGKIDAIYDRAALVALPANMRQAYAQKLTEICQLAPKLLITLEYDQSKMDGPPFSVTETEVRALYETNYQVKQLKKHDVLANNAKFNDKGINALNECVYQLIGVK